MVDAAAVKLDVKDKKLLSMLESDARASLAKLSSKTNISKQLIDYRIKRMLSSGLIKRFNLVCCLAALNYSSFKVYVRFKDLNQKKEKEIISYLVDHPFTGSVIICEGKWDMMFSLFAEGFVEFNSLMEEIMMKIGGNVENYDSNILFSMAYAPFSILGVAGDKVYKRPLAMFPDRSDAVLDRDDMRVLEQLSSDSRMNLAEMSTRLGIPYSAVRYKLKRLLSSGVISEFKTIIDYELLGLDRYVLLFDVNNISQKDEISFTESVSRIPEVMSIAKCMGKWDFEVSLIIENNKRLRKVLLKIRDILSEKIISYDILIVFDEHKNTTLPKGIIENVKSSGR